MKRLRMSLRGLREYKYPQGCSNPRCKGLSEFRVVEHADYSQVLVEYCPFCGKKTLICKKCKKTNYHCCCVSLSEDYYRTFGGSCRKVSLTDSNRMDEFPYNRKNAIPCKRKGRHPHVSKSVKRRVI